MKEQKKSKMLVSIAETQLIQADLSSFLNSCQLIGIKPSDFETTVHCIIDRVVDGSDDTLPTRELKIPLLFLRALETLLNSLQVQIVK